MEMTKAVVIEAIDEVVQALAEYELRTDSEVELILESDGAASLRTGQPGADSFTEVARFQCFEDLWTFLQMGEAA